MHCCESIGGVRKVDDLLGHDQIAQSIIGHIEKLDPGTVVAVQGSWGRGKTDVLQRLKGNLEERQGSPKWPPPLWINPWSYGRPDLVSPLLAQMTQCLPPADNQHKEKLKLGAKALLRAANAIAFKGVSVVVPDAGFLEAASKPIDDLITSLFASGQNDKGDHDLDPVSVMGVRFRELVETYLQIMGEEGGRLVIFVDDLDRCMPDHQIAMLEAMHFLTAARAPAVFVIALDPELVHQAAYTHYKVQSFDTDLYLNKIFDLRINLPISSTDALVTFININFDDDCMGTSVREYFASQTDVDELIKWSISILSLPEIHNPRTINKIFQRVRLFINRIQSIDSVETSQPLSKVLFAWCVLCECWPWVRELCAYVDEDRHDEFLTAIRDFYVDEEKIRGRYVSGLVLRIRLQSECPDLEQFLTTALSVPDADFVKADRVLRSCGL